ncbi:MAG TPA: hypothetical protein VHY58_18010 [Streptosporangiaceae bacterium]|jgi:hypothetical protein|nr:hypothetical protein [Streptosporangiaceae bacterium]
MAGEVEERVSETTLRVPPGDRADREGAVRMIDEADLRLMSPEQRARLARTIAALDLPRSRRDPKVRMRRRIALAVVIACCLFLAVWIVVLALTLPTRYKAGGWRGAWVGLDIVELLALASVAWTAWRGKQLLIVCMIVTATLMCCDAWFDLTLDWGTRAFSFSLLSAIFAELPVAVMLILGTRRLLRLTIATTMALQGDRGPVPPLWKVPLLGTGPGEPADSLRPRARGSAEGVPQGGGDVGVTEVVVGLDQAVRQHPRAGQ